MDTINAFMTFHPIRTQLLLVADLCAAAAFAAWAVRLHIAEREGQ